MKAERKEPPEAATKRQIAAADPDSSVFVSANAGSGKTHVLVQRAINLLLRGADPAKILCITFTKAAAANMATRVFGTLAEWTALDDETLDDRIKKSTGKPSDARQRATARRLFANALETPGGLKVQTIHAFCTRLLHQFPFEANVAARFEVLDETSTSEMLNKLTLDVILEGAGDPESALGQALATAITSAADITFKEVIAETIGLRELVTKWIARAGGVPQAIAEVTRMFNLAPGDNLAAVEAEYLSGKIIPQSEWPALIEFLRTSDKKSDREHADRLSEALRRNGREAIETYVDVFCTGERKGRSAILTKKFGDANPQWANRLTKEQDRVCALVAREFAIRARDRSAALLTVAAAVIERYEKEKERRGALDYEDLIAKTLALFRNASAAWVLYKLDLGIDHVLVDEAQDTSPQQWEIIKTIVAEFAPGGSRPNVRRTLFAVGDEKQSIFSFQGAAPLAFAENREHFRKLHEGSDTQFRIEKLEYSFRSAYEVLHAVDTVFKQEVVFKGLTADPAWTVHQALPDAAPGEVELWPMIAPDEKDDTKEGWDAPFDTTSETSPAIKLARRIAATVKIWLARGLRPRDVLILVRQRGPLFEAVIRALKHEAIDVAGADRLVLTEHIAIMDLLVLGDVLLLPEDDLALATVLRSPLFALSDEQLYKLAYGRGDKPLRAVLEAKASEDPDFKDAAATLDKLAEKAKNSSPFVFYAHVLGARKGRAKILARLGVEASDPLDEFLNLALTYEQRETPSLQGFLDWMRAAQSEVKRDMEIARDEVRVMTVHGAKGLEAKNVILIDGTTTRPEGAHPPRLLVTPIAGAAPGAQALIWGVAKDKDAGPMVDARNRALDEARNEYRRLLYVAMTRAAEKLVVCGTKGAKKEPADCWYNLVENALKPLCATEPADDGNGEVLRFRKKGERATVGSGREKETEATPLPAWLTQDAGPDPKPIRIVRPSTAIEDDFRPHASAEPRLALLRGTLVHRLMQSLPDIPSERRAAAAKNYLDRAGGELDTAQRAQLSKQVLALLSGERFRELFAPSSRAEVPIVGKLTINGETVKVSGQVDRLAVTETSILIGDYKTNRPAPKRIEDAPPHYVSQLALYRAVLQKLCPGRTVRAAIVWTEVPDLMELSPEAMDTALHQVTSA